MKIKDGIVGLTVGDALGVPVEFRPREYLIENPVTSWNIRQAKGNLV